MKKLLCLMFLFSSLSVTAQSISIVASDTTICAGARAIFTAITDSFVSPHYQWQVNGSDVGADTNKLVTDTISDGDIVICLFKDSFGTILAWSDTIIMTLYARPDAGTISGMDTVCVGTTISLSASVAGGVWKTLHTYASVDANGIVTGIRGGSSFECYRPPGYDSIMYLVSNANCTDTAYRLIIVHPQPTPGFFFDFGSGVTNAVCVNGQGSINYGVGPCGALYSKYHLVFIGFTTISGSKAGTDSIYSIATNYCGTKTYSQLVYVYDKPTATEIVSSATRMCVGDTIILSTSPPSGSRGEWVSSNTNAFISDKYIDSIKVWGVNAGLDTITVRNINQCGRAPAKKIVISVDSLPQIDPFNSGLCKNSITILTNSLPGGMWSSSDIKKANINSQGGVLGIDTGEVWISYTSTMGCYTKEKLTVVHCPDLVDIFPNPITDEFIVHVTIPGKYSNYTLINSMGQVLLTKPLKGEFTIVNSSELIPGMYFVVLKGKGTVYRSKFVKQ